jgi:hypothetical protein
MTGRTQGHLGVTGTKISLPPEPLSRSSSISSMARASFHSSKEFAPCPLPAGMPGSLWTLGHRFPLAGEDPLPNGSVSWPRILAGCHRPSSVYSVWNGRPGNPV